MPQTMKQHLVFWEVLIPAMKLWFKAFFLFVLISLSLCDKVTWPGDLGNKNRSRGGSSNHPGWCRAMLLLKSVDKTLSFPLPRSWWFISLWYSLVWRWINPNCLCCQHSVLIRAPIILGSRLFYCSQFKYKPTKFFSLNEVSFTNTKT